MPRKARYLGPPRRPFRAVIGLGTSAYPGGGGQDTRIRDMCPDSASRWITISDGRNTYRDFFLPSTALAPSCVFVTLVQTTCLKRVSYPTYPAGNVFLAGRRDSKPAAGKCPVSVNPDEPPDRTRFSGAGTTFSETGQLRQDNTGESPW